MRRLGRPRARETMTPAIVAIVTAYNEAERIGATLAALASAFPGARLIVGDDGSQRRDARSRRLRRAPAWCAASA